MLKVEDLNVSYNGLQALMDINIEVEEREFVSIIGSNGAGKTTLLRCISGLIRPTSGTILFAGEPIHRYPPHLICMKGVLQVPEGRKLFPKLRVMENLEMGAYLPEARIHFKDSLRWVFQLFPVLSERRYQQAGTLSGGEQQMLALARTLMARPRMLMLDEPSLGLAPKVAVEIFRTIEDLNAQGMTLLLVSQEVMQALRISRRAYVLENGEIVLKGSAMELLSHPDVKKAYLGI